MNTEPYEKKNKFVEIETKMFPVRDRLRSTLILTDLTVADTDIIALLYECVTQNEKKNSS